MFIYTIIHVYMIYKKRNNSEYIIMMIDKIIT